MASYTFPSSAELKRIEPDIQVRLMEGRVIFDLFPIVEYDHSLVKWDQRDTYLGLQQVRGLNGDPPRVKRVGHKQFMMVPGVYGEFVSLDEQELTTRRQIGTFGEPIRLDDLIGEADEHLQQRELDRIEWMIWTLFATGTFSVAGPAGGIIHTDSYTTQTFDAVVGWGTSATATPLADFRSVQLLGAGKGVQFDAGSQAFMNRVTLNKMLSNTNPNDLAGRRVTGLLSVLNLGEVNAILSGEDLPQIVPYDQGYFTDAGTFTRFIPNDRVIVIGRRPNGDSVGEYQKTRNANNPDLGPGSYTLIEDTLDTARPPRQVKVHRGHNGGVALLYPSAVVAMDVS